MARIRSIKPEFWVSEQVAECSTNARLTFVGLWNFCDDQGVHPAKPKTLKAELYPMDDISAADVGAWMTELVDVGLVAIFESGGQSYWHVTGWARHQKIDRPSCKHPAPTGIAPALPVASEFEEKSSSEQQTLVEDSTNARRAPPPGVEGIGEEGKGDASPKARRASKRPLPSGFAVSDQVKAWADSKGFGDLQQHLEHFIGKAKASDYRYVDWDQAFMGAVRDDWAKLRDRRNGAAPASATFNFDGVH